MMQPFIEEIYDTCQQSIELFNEEIDDLYDSISLFRESLKEFSDELSELYSSFDSICDEAEEVDLSMTEILAVLLFVGKLQGFEDLLSKTKKKKTYRFESGSTIDPLPLHTGGYSDVFFEDEEIPF